MSITYSTGTESPSTNTNDNQAVYLSDTTGSLIYSYYNEIRGRLNPPDVTGTYEDDQLVPWSALVFGKTYTLQYNTTSGMNVVGSLVEWTTWTNKITITSRKNDYPSIRFRLFRNSRDIIELYINEDGDLDYKLPAFTETSYYNKINKTITTSSLYIKDSDGYSSINLTSDTINTTILSVNIPAFKLCITCPYSSRPTGLKDLRTGWFIIEAGGINPLTIVDKNELSVTNFTTGTTSGWTNISTIYTTNLNTSNLINSLGGNKVGSANWTISVMGNNGTNIIGYISSATTYNNNNYSAAVANVDKIEFLMQSYSSSSSSGTISKPLKYDSLDDRLSSTDNKS